MDINSILHLVAERKASDLHLRVPSPPVLRLNGALVPVGEWQQMTAEDTKEVFESITSESQRDTFYRELELDLAYSVAGLGRFRVNVSLQRGTFSLSFRPVPLHIPSIDELNLPEVCKSLILRSKGLVLVTGPTGSGKSTTLAAMIDYLNECECRNVITIEDPIEFLHSNKKCLIAQRDLGDDTRSFATALRHVLRQDPDVVMLGEMRDLDTIATAITAAETGHLVLGTLHTTSAPQTIDRIIDVFPPNQQQQIRMQLSLVLEGVISQVLLPRADGGGRVAAFEVMVATPAIKNLIREGKTFQISSYLQTGGQYGMQTLDQALQALVEKGLVTIDEALMRTSTPDELRSVVQRT